MRSPTSFIMEIDGPLSDVQQNPFIFLNAMVQLWRKCHLFITVNGIYSKSVLGHLFFFSVAQFWSTFPHLIIWLLFLENSLKFRNLKFKNHSIDRRLWIDFLFFFFFSKIVFFHINTRTFFTLQTENSDKCVNYSVDIVGLSCKLKIWFDFGTIFHDVDERILTTKSILFYLM